MPRRPATRAVVLVVPMGSSVRVALRSDVLRGLREAGVPVAILTPAHADPSFQQEFQQAGVEIAPLELTGPPSLRRDLRGLWRLWQPKAWRGLVSTLNHYGYRLGGSSGSHRQKEDKLREERRWHYAARRLLRIPYQWPALRDRLLRAEVRWYRHPVYDALLDRLRPAVMFTANMFAKGADGPLKSAARRGIPVVGMVHSWDNVTTADRQLTFLMDRFVVWNEILRDELVAFHGVDPDRIVVTGTPQFDLHVRLREAMPSRHELCAGLGLDPGRRIVLYAGCAPLLFPEEPELMDRLAGLAEAGALGPNVQLVVRLHFKDRMDRWQAVARRHPALVFESAGRSRSAFFDNWDPTEEDLRHFVALVRHSDVCINMASTVTIDAAVFDTPIVNIAYDAGRRKPFLQSVRRYYRYDHYARIVATGGVTVVHNDQELVRAVHAYLADPGLHREGRARIVRSQCHLLDGKAGRRIADLLLNYCS